jgi:hypothetical protein
MDFGWGGIEQQKGHYDWSAYEELIANLDKRGLRAVCILDYSNPLYEETVASKNPLTGREQRDTASPQHPDSVATFSQWAAAAGQHFRGRHIIWEIWNEPNISFWKPKPNVEQYNVLALATAKAIRQVVPDATIVGPATSGIPLEYLESVFKSGLLEHLDAVSVHPYRNYSLPPESAIQDYAKLRALIERYAPNEAKKTLPILSGEWGYASHNKGVSLETQAAFIARQQLANVLAGVPLSIWYDWKNDGPDATEREDNFGTVTSDLKPKPSYVAIQTLTRELSGYRIVRRLKVGTDNDYVLLCAKASGDQKLAAWTSNQSSSLSIPITQTISPIRLVRTDGQSATTNAGEGKLALELAPAPVYVTLAPARVQE